MVLRRLIVVKHGMLCVAARDSRFVSCQHVVRILAMLGGLSVMARRLLMVVGRCGVMLCNAERGVIGARLTATFDRAQPVGMGQQSLMRRMGVVFPIPVKPRRLTMKSRGLRVVNRCGCVRFGGIADSSEPCVRAPQPRSKRGWHQVPGAEAVIASGP